MKKRIAFALAALLGAAVLMGAQVDPDEYVPPRFWYGQSDGMYQDRDTRGFTLMQNGYRLNELAKHTFAEDFTEYGDGEMACMQTDDTACSGTNTEMNWVHFGAGNRFGVYVTGTVTAPGIDMDAASLDIAGDQGNDEGVEIFYGGLYQTGGAPFIVGEHPNFYTCARFTIEDASGLDDFQIGFRKYEPIQDAWDNYDEAAAIGIVGNANPNNIYIQTILNGGGTTDTDTGNNIADGATDTYCVYVSSAGVVTYTIDGKEPGTTAAFTIDDGEILIPFIKILQHSDLSGEVDLLNWDVGFKTAPF